MTQDEIIRMARDAISDTINQHDQMLKRLWCIAYEEGQKAEREQCAKVCEEIEQDRWNLYKGRPPYTGSESGRADPHEQGVSMGAGECAAAIRARGEK